MFTVPTDNLYKFIALFGLSLVITGFSLSYVEYGAYRKSDNDLLNLYSEIEIKTKLYELSAAQNKELLEKIEKRTVRGLIANQDDLNEMREIYNELKKITEAMCKLTTDSVPKIRELKNNQKHSIYSFSSFFALILFGLGVSSFGFYKWSKST